MSNITINVTNLSKRYRLGELQEDLLQERLIKWLKRPFHSNGASQPETIFALQDVSFTVNEGEVLGIIGKNGAGKSTLLKLLSKITYPTIGAINVKGRVAALLEVGTGFHGELTGKENIFLNGSILGMTKKEINSKLDAIVTFAGVEKFIDTPVKHFSSGMYLRLGFAVAAHLEPDVLLVDEVLAVGDAAFQKKCLNAMDELRAGGRTVLFVSHNMAAVENLCSRALWIDDGQLRMDGPAKEVIETYMASNAEASRLGADLSNMSNRRGCGDIQFSKVELLDCSGKASRFVSSGNSLVIRLHYRCVKKVTRPDFEISLFTNLGTLITRFSTWIDYQISAIFPGEGYLDLAIDSLNFMPGRYYLSLCVKTQGPTIFDMLEHCLQFEVEPSDVYGSGRGMNRHFGIVFLPRKWSINVIAGQDTDSSSMILAAGA